MNSPLVSIVVCTFNRSAMLREALASLLRLEAGPAWTYEIVVVDNRSTDSTAQVVAAIAATTSVPVRREFEPQAGVVYARNCGVQAARGEWIAFFDDDQLAEPNWLKELLATAEARRVPCVGGAVLLKLPDDCQRQLSPVSRMLLGETVGMNHPRPYDYHVTPGAGNLLLRRSLFTQIGMFDLAYNHRGEDTEFILRMLKAGYSGWFTPTALVWHVTPPERLTDDYLRRLSRVMSSGLAVQERSMQGALVYPFVWCARLVQTACLLWPRWVGARLRGDVEHTLGASYRLEIARGYLRTGWALMRGKRPAWSA